MRLALLPDHPETLPTIARWHFDEWASSDPEMTVQRVLDEKLGDFLNRDGAPFMVVALNETGDPEGTAGVKLREMSIFPELEYWLSAVYVAPSSRGRGLGSALIDECLRRARLLGIRTLHLQTEHLEGGLYLDHGFQPLKIVDHQGYRALIMSRQL